MSEVPRPREHHGDVVLVGGVDHFLIADGAAGLDHGGGACFDGLEKTIGEREEGVGGDGAALEVETRKLSLSRGDHRRVDARHLSGADAERAVLGGVDDRVRLHMLCNAPGEYQRAQLALGRLALRDDAEIGFVEEEIVGALREYAAGD